ncbi:MAG TPA: SOS response-associated peptidase [Tepidisphaeraceae bacterium]|jgi:putative SOS response-associated peptidase YedK|nr:SOS response-associated peptidase [Tepidisphaeraceae bacterium]
MCGRYTLFRLDQLLKNFPNLRIPPEMLSHFNIAPTQSVLAIANNHPDQLEIFHWGLVPSWAKDPSAGNRMINARAETLAEKPAFKTALRRRRCLVPADGFYEWRKEGGGIKTPMYIHLKSGEMMAFAGLWDVWHSPDGSMLPSLTIVTTAANPLMASIHDRMPAIVRKDDRARWLTAGEVEPKDMADILRPFPADEMEAYPVSTQVNKPANDSPDCIEKAETGLLF